MRILWIVNVILPRIEKMQNKNTNSVYGGWLSGLSDSLLEDDSINLCVCYPHNGIDFYTRGSENNFSFYGLSMKKDKYIKEFSELLDEFKPDVIHFFGTEFSRSYNLLKVCENKNYLDNSVVSIQGLVSVYADHFFPCISNKWKYLFTLTELIHKNTLQMNYKNYVTRGLDEIEEIKLAKNIIGRTTWDKACALRMNSEINYYFCNETLRSSFYVDSWSYELCDKHTIYISQSTKPLKGFHIFLKALSIVVKTFPDTKVYVAGDSFINGNWIHGSTYGMYIKHLLKSLKLQDNVIFLGRIQEQEVKSYLLKCNAFVLPSSIENSPNSLGEAMLLGIPCIASDVGGVKDMMVHNVEGYVYPYDEIDLLAYYILDIFKNREKADSFSYNAQNHANITHNRELNKNRLIEIYKKIGKLS